MTTHELKLDIKYFDDVKNGKKNFEIRKNDRNYQVGDILELIAYKKDSFVFWRTTPSENHEDYWQTCLKERADKITVRVVSIVKDELWNKCFESPMTVSKMIKSQTGFSYDNLVVIEEVLCDYFHTNALPDGYVILGIEVAEWKY